MRVVQKNTDSRADSYHDHDAWGVTTVDGEAQVVFRMQRTRASRGGSSTSKTKVDEKKKGGTGITACLLKTEDKTPVKLQKWGADLPKESFERRAQNPARGPNESSGEQRTESQKRKALTRGPRTLGHIKKRTTVEKAPEGRTLIPKTFPMKDFVTGEAEEGTMGEKAPNGGKSLLNALLVRGWGLKGRGAQKGKEGATG